MNKTITKPTADQLRKYNEELLNREKHERKDKFILLSLTVAGLLGVYALVLSGVQQNNLTETENLEKTQEVQHPSTKAAVRSMR